MRYIERKQFLYDPDIFKLSDTQTALGMSGEYVRASSPIPLPKFFEVDRSFTNFDALWHMPLTDRTVFTRELEVPCIATFAKPDWRLTKLGIKATQQFNFWLANIHLTPPDKESANDPKAVRLDYFPLRGDMIFYIGYRLMIINVYLEPSAYWQQTNVWTGLICQACIAPDGDARPIPNLGVAAPSEKPGQSAPMDWPGEPPIGPTNIPHLWP